MLTSELGTVRPVEPLSSVFSGSDQFFRLSVDLAHGLGDLVHVGARAQEHGLGQPDGRLAEPVVGRAMDPLEVLVNTAAAE